MILTFRQMVIMTTCSIIASSSLAARAQMPCSYSVTILPDVDCGVWQAPGNAVAMNNNGVVVGHFISCGGSQNDSFYWNGGATLTVIPKPQWMQSFVAADINDDGLIVGTAVKVGVGDRAVIYNIATGQWTEIAPQNPSNGWSAATGINNSGQVCGWRSIDDGGDPTTPQTAFIYDIATGQINDLGLYNGESTGASAINELGAATGTIRIDNIPQPMLWAKGEVIPLGTLAGLETYPFAINGAVQIVGWSGLPMSKWPFQGAHAFLWDGVEMFDLGTLPGDNRSVAAAINDSGIVVGFSRYLVQGEPQVDRGFLWHEERMYELTKIVDELSVDKVSSASHIVNDGRILARIRFSSGSSAIAVLHPNSSLVGDVDGNCAVDVNDLLAVIYAWGTTDSAADLNDDTVVNVLDLLIVIQNWTVLP